MGLIAAVQAVVAHGKLAHDRDTVRFLMVHGAGNPVFTVH
jgi:hypothetical protein